MKVIAVNGSPKQEGNTFLALRMAAAELERQGIATEVLHIGHRDIRGCMACNACRKTGRCAYADEAVDEAAQKLYEADGILLGSPVYYAGINGTMKSFLDRVFYASNGRMRHKVGAGVAVVRRSGGMTAFNQLNEYFLISEMLIAPSFYWNVAHGGAPGEVQKDAEAASVLANLGRNMAWMLHMKQQTAQTLPPPTPVARAWMNFIRE